MRRRQLFIIGASHFGRELEGWLERVPLESRDWEVVGFLHKYEGKSPLEGFPTDFKILGDWKEFPFPPDALCLNAVADPAYKEIVYRGLAGKVEFFTFVSPDAIVSKFCHFTEGTIICPRCIIQTNVRLGRCVTVNVGTQLGHDVRVGDFSSIMGGVSLNGGVEVGQRVFIGSKALVIPKLRVKDDAYVGAGSVVVKNIPEKIKVFGNPAKRIDGC